MDGLNGRQELNGVSPRPGQLTRSGRKPEARPTKCPGPAPASACPHILRGELAARADLSIKKILESL